MAYMENPFAAFGLFLVVLVAAIAFPDFSLKWIVWEVDDPFLTDMFKTGLALVAVSILTWPIWAEVLG